MAEDLKHNPLSGKPTRRSRARVLTDLYDSLTLPIAIAILLDKSRIHRDYKMSLAQRMRLGFQMYRNTKAVYTGTSYRAHLAMAQKILSIPKSVPGVVVECGCFRGGTTANLSLVCDIVGRDLIVYDSFEGLPPPTDGDQYANDFGTGLLAASLDQVRDHVTQNGAVDRCTFVKGYFEDTLPHHDEPIVFMFFDVDYQASLHDCMLNLWPQLYDEGYLFTDEYLLVDYCALFYSERYWKTYFDSTPPGLLGAGSGLPLGGYYTGPFKERSAVNRPLSIAYTRKDFSGHWKFYPEPGQPTGSATQVNEPA